MMKPFTVETLCHWTKGKLQQGDMSTLIRGVKIDSRMVQSEDLFIPIAGDRFDGHDFILQAAQAGAAATFIMSETHRHDQLSSSFAVIAVNDTLQALQEMAHHYRLQYQFPMIAITGSNGKTTTKDMVASVLNVMKPVLKSHANYNNHIGLPLTLMQITPEHAFAVLEMGMSGIGEISLLSRLAKPDIAVITNVGWAHIEKLGSIDQIGAAKLEIIDGLSSDGVLLINGDDLRLAGISADKKNFPRVVKTGLLDNNDLQAVDVCSEGPTGFSFKTNRTGRYRFVINHPGIHHIISGLFAVWIGLEWGMPASHIQQGFDQFTPSGMRMEIESKNGRTFINDSYNANPDSMKAALQYLKSYPAHKRYAVLGNMLELGNYAESCHRDMAVEWFEAGIDHLVTLGDMASWIAQEAMQIGAERSRIYEASDVDDVIDYLNRTTKKGDVILVKGSRAMGMERIIKGQKEGE